MNIRELSNHLESLVIFRAVLDDAVVARLRTALGALEAGEGAVGALADFESALFAHTCDWTEYLLETVLEDENLCVRRRSPLPAQPALRACLARELDFLTELGALTLSRLLTMANAEEAGQFLTPWEVSHTDFAAAYEARAAQAGQRGYGMFAKYHVFTVSDGALVPVRCPDSQTLSELPGYEREREKVISNTRALLAGTGAANVLLYGDAGTGKSSTVKAIANAFAPEGLRLVEVKKHQLYQIPALMDELSRNPLKFILFIDDLSFTAGDDNFAALKAILEGSVSGSPRNIAVYATSNRRHLVKETFTDRDGDELYAADTRQEMMSLAARFGLTVTFLRPEKQRFREILLALAPQYGVDCPEEQLVERAEAFALRSGGRSPRVARQFLQLYGSGVTV
ncbi:ATP-binding protein [uncultured Oscillibacter sp.]|uniref:ATP-binding protein n=1 Tax=uncultured Oscillibacter sp. TaxID=876091 RepID=UPI00280AB8F2|nr:ATP-binding protein [uncultured Oscillibacter sp.]